MMLRPDVEYNTPLKPCKIKIDEILYSAVMQEHRLISEEINVNREIITDCTSIRKYIFEEPFAVFKPESFMVECDDEYYSMCYMSDNRLSIIEMEGTKMDFSKVMNPPEDGFDGQADIKVDRNGLKWVYCPWCHKKHFPVNNGAKIYSLEYQCRNSKCKKIFVVNAG